MSAKIINQNVKRIFGIDPGSRATGIGVVDVFDNNVMLCVYAGVVRLEAPDMFSRLSELFLKVKDLVAEYKPQEVAIEQVFMHKNVASALKLGQARGVLIAATVGNNLPIFEYAPRQIKQAVTGTGAAAKSQVQLMVAALLQLPAKPLEDAADALAVAICHANSTAVLGCVPAKHTRKSGSRGLNWSNYDISLTRDFK